MLLPVALVVAEVELPVCAELLGYEEVPLLGEVVCEPLVPVCAPTEPLALPEVDPVALPDWLLVDPEPVENVSFEVDFGSLLGLVPVVPAVPEVDVSLCPLVVLPLVLPDMLPEVLGVLEVLPALASAPLCGVFVCVCVDDVLPWDEPAVCATAKLVTSASTNNVASACFFISKNSPGGN